MYDVIIVGGGPAGLSAALVLGRCRRTVLVTDEGEYRNMRSSAMHGFLTRDGVLPAEFLRLARADLDPGPRRHAVVLGGPWPGIDPALGSMVRTLRPRPGRAETRAGKT